MPTFLQYALALLLLAHGYVHVVFVASSRRWFGGEGGWRWHGRSWLLSGVLDEGGILDLASAGFLLAALGFAVGAVGYVLSAGSWAPVLAGAAVLSAALYLVLWDGSPDRPLEQGALGVLVDAGVIGWVALVG